MSRYMYDMVKEIADEEGLKFKSYTGDWVIELEKDGKLMHIYGYRFPNNPSCIDRILSDKSACFDMLNNSNFDAIEHILLTKTSDNDFLDKESENYKFIVNKLNQYGTIVLKNNSDSSGGKSVYRVSNLDELDLTLLKLSDKRTISLSPYFNIECEYRFIVLDGETMVCYAKERPYVVGDDQRTVQELIAEKYGEFDNHEEIDLEYVPKQNEKFLLSWKHNLIKGSRPVEIKDKTLEEKLKNTAREISNRFNIHFASIDFAQVGNKLSVLEINSGVLMEKYSEESEENRQRAKEVYRKAIMKNFV